MLVITGIYETALLMAKDEKLLAKYLVVLCIKPH